MKENMFKIVKTVTTKQISFVVAKNIVEANNKLSNPNLWSCSPAIETNIEVYHYKKGLDK